MQIASSILASTIAGSTQEIVDLYQRKLNAAVLQSVKSRRPVAGGATRSQKALKDAVPELREHPGDHARKRPVNAQDDVSDANCRLLTEVVLSTACSNTSWAELSPQDVGAVS